ncbi:acyltransferase [Strigomonas culicis]|uniref:Acyltransferase n=2 Tax=Strigomonas culicis TaxID=28005 RepID=S9WCE4_9TRYP|nr:acyltransferase [Strigomonas culicis]EPY33730.1 acyltransferase [Strigomonas culicis]|eukprot:EPY21027.1 acyltransferase [Strigomonas culicis]
MLVCVLLGVAYAIFWYLMKARMLPVIVMRFWFTLNLVIVVILSWLFCKILGLLYSQKIIQKETYHSLSRCVCATFFGIPLRLNSPHIQVKFMEGSLPWSEINVQHDLCLCHTSFFDTLLYLWFVPYRYVYTAKTFAKASLRNLPLFGHVIRACGQFPVYFSSEESDSFSVEKEKQMKVAEEVEEFLSHGGSLSFFPEGALNRTPEVLKDFRLGSFNTILKHKLRLFYTVTYGNHEVWNSKLKGIPGYPADIYMFIGEYKYDPATVDARSLATGLREAMQKQLDQMLELRKTNGYVPYFVVKDKAQ